MLVSPPIYLSMVRLIACLVSDRIELTMLQKKKGLVSEAGLERLAERNGLESLKEDHMGAGGHKMKTLVIAGSSTQIDIVLDNDIVQGVTLAFPGLSQPTSKLMEPASQILLQDLKLRPYQSPLTKTLDNFAANLERLACLDQLSIIEAGFICHEALTGMYTSLERIHQWDMARLREQTSMSGRSDDYLTLMAMCKRNGLPVMHAHGRIGLALQYWKEKRFVPPSSKRARDLVEKHEKVWSLAIECKPMDHHIMMPPVRVSDSWISEKVVKDDGMGTDPDNLPLDWQEPEQISLPAPEEGKADKAMEMLQPDLSSKRVPPVKFTVTFDPPVVLTHPDYMRLHNTIELEPQMPMMFPPPTFDVMHFPIPPGAPHNASELRTIQRHRQVPVYDTDGQPSEITHRNTLFNYKRIYATSVTELSFSHPKQLIAMLPILRQYAFLTVLLQNSFGPGTEDAPSTSSSTSEKPTKVQMAAETVTVNDELSAFMMGQNGDGKENGMAQGNGSVGTSNVVNMDVSVWVHPNLHLKVVFPFRTSTANIEMHILENGAVDIINENILQAEADGPSETGEGKGRKLTRADLAEVLERLEDLCKWAEWIRTRLS